jgi:hypothetical protein
MTRLTFEMSEDARLLSQSLLKAEQGSLLKYEQLSEIIGKPITSARAALQTARRYALREEGIVFGVERGIGIRRLNDDEIVAASVAQRKFLRNKARRAAKELSAADYRMLTAAKQLMATATMSIFLTIKATVSDRAVQTLQVLGGSSKSLPIKETLQALLRSQDAHD